MSRTSKEEKEAVLKKLEDGTFVLHTRAGTSASTVWSKFDVVSNALTNKSEGFVQCRGCKGLLKFTSSTSSLQNHKCKQPDQHPNNVREVPAEAKSLVVEKCARWCSLDLRPFTVVAGEGFRDVAEALISIGAKYGPIKAADIVPHPTTVSRHISDVADEIRLKTLPGVKDAMKIKACAATSDMWTDKFRKLHYLTMTVHYITQDWNLMQLTLFTRAFPDVTKSGEHIIKELVEICAELGIDNEDLQGTTFVTDQGSNMVKALELFERLSCMAHIMNTVLKHTFEDSFLQRSAPELFQSIKAAKNVVAYMKKTGLVVRLDNTLHLNIETRWNSLCALLKSLHSQFETVQAILEEKGQGSRTLGYNNDLVGKVVRFLSVFKEATDSLEADKTPTVHLVLPWITKLKSHCMPVADDCEVMTSIKARASAFLIQKAILEDVHYISAFLWPKFRFLVGLGEPMKRRVHDMVRRKCLAVVTSNTPATPEGTENDPSPPKKSCPFEEWIQEEEHVPVDEVNLYILMGKDDPSETLLQWWMKREQVFPRLSQVARAHFAIPATSASSERAFSRAGYVINDRRSSISSKSVDDLLFVNSHRVP